jgi:hypothetical protein
MRDSTPPKCAQQEQPTAATLSAELLTELLELVKRLNQIAAFAIQIGANEQAAKLLERVLGLADAMFVPSSGAGNLPLLAALMNRSERAVEEMVKREEIPTHRPTQDRIVRFEDILGQRDDPAADLARTVNTLATDPQARKLLGRFLSLADAMFVPSSGAGNFELLAALLNRSPRSIQDLIEREQIPTHQPTRDRLVRFNDVIRSEVTH